ncbi:hypothetical protein AC628_26820 [Bradyrhizobium sp. NAS96.2]|nr:hypothetical protein AC628_26820 [Bradyrhizobium sp. NAS96.2]
MRNCEMPAGTMVVGTADTHWYWGVSLPQDTYHALTFVGAKRLSEAPIALLERSLPPDTKSRPITFNGAADATFRVARRAIGQGWLRVGDAFIAPDPLSSSGLYIAVLTAIQSARVINTILRRPSDVLTAETFYKNTHREMAAHFVAATASFYLSEESGPVAKVEPSANSHELSFPLSDLILSPSAKLHLVPTLTNDFVVMAPGLVRSNKPPVVFVDGIPVDRLLAPLQAGGSLASAVSEWIELAIPSRLRFVQFLLENAFLIEKRKKRNS